MFVIAIHVTRKTLLLGLTLWFGLSATDAYPQSRPRSSPPTKGKSAKDDATKSQMKLRTSPGTELAVANLSFQQVAGFMEVSGQVKNLTDKDLDHLVANIQFVAVAEIGKPRVRGSGVDMIKPSPLKPGEVGTFMVRDKADRLVNDYKLTFEEGNKLLRWEVVNTDAKAKSKGQQIPQPELTVTGVSYNLNGGIMEVNGRVKNVTDKKVTNLAVKVEWLSQPQKFNFSTRSLIEPRGLMPGEVGTFNVRAEYDRRIKDYQLVFESGSNPLLWQFENAQPGTAKKRR